MITMDLGKSQLIYRFMQDSEHGLKLPKYLLPYGIILFSMLLLICSHKLGDSLALSW